MKALFDKSERVSYSLKISWEEKLNPGECLSQKNEHDSDNNKAWDSINGKCCNLIYLLSNCKTCELNF